MHIGKELRSNKMNVNEKALSLAQYLKKKNSKEQILCFGDINKFEIGVGVKEELIIYGSEVTNSKQVWEEINSFLERFDLANIVGYIGYDVVYQNPSGGELSSFPLVHLIVPKEMYRVTSLGVYKNEVSFDFRAKKTSLLPFSLVAFDKDKENKDSYLKIVQDTIKWIGEQKERKTTISRKVFFSHKVDLLKPLGVQLDEGSYYFYYFNCCNCFIHYEN